MDTQVFFSGVWHEDTAGLVPLLRLVDPHARYGTLARRILLTCRQDGSPVPLAALRAGVLPSPTLPASAALRAAVQRLRRAGRLVRVRRNLYVYNPDPDVVCRRHNGACCVE